MFDYIGTFRSIVAALLQGRRYRVFAELQRQVGQFFRAIRHSATGDRHVVVWCSNDYLCTGQHPAVIQAMCDTARNAEAGAGGTRNISGTNPERTLGREAETIAAAG